LEVLLERGIGLLGAGDIAGLEIPSQLAKESGNGVLLAGGLGGAGVVMMEMRLAYALLLLAGLLDILLDGGDVGLRGGEIAGFEVLRKLGDGDSEQIATLRAGGGSDRGGLRPARKKLLERSEITLGLREIAGLQVLAELLKTLLELLGFAVSSKRIELGKNAVGDGENGHACFLFCWPGPMDGSQPGERKSTKGAKPGIWAIPGNALIAGTLAGAGFRLESSGGQGLPGRKWSWANVAGRAGAAEGG
jgi:hypothetical protein